MVEDNAARVKLLAVFKLEIAAFAHGARIYCVSAPLQALAGKISLMSA